MRDKIKVVKSENVLLKAQINATRTKSSLTKRSADKIQSPNIEEIKNILSTSLSNLERFNTTFIDELMKEFYTLEIRHDEIKNEKEVQSRRMGIITPNI